MVRIVQMVLCVVAINPLAVAQDERIEFFEKKIRPVLAANCFECHGPKKQDSDLRLDHDSFLGEEGNYGAILVPGKPEESGLYSSLTHEDEELMMPYERKKLDAAVIANFKKWIADGAVWPDEPPPTGDAEPFDLIARQRRLPWIWQKPHKQIVPEPQNRAWPQTDIDRFILAKLEEYQLVPASDAAAEVWLRRVHFAITGLPPTPEQIQQFLANPSIDRREKVVDQLLDSPHFGERWARHWMDLVRYAESRGHESDFPIANAWHYRDYLIRAFNDDVPYDQFVKEHVAGDLLESPRINEHRGFNESILATAWPFFGEEVHSPVDIRQDECERIDNKIDVFSKTFLGLTVACARCHDHKFDAITQKDYYALSGFVLSSHFRQIRFETMQQNRAVSDQLDKLYLSTQRKLAGEVANSFGEHIPEAVKFARVAMEELAGEEIDPVSCRLDSDRMQAWKAAMQAAPEDPISPLRLLYEQPAQAKVAKSTVENKPQVVADYSDRQQVWLTSGNAFGQSAKRTGDLALPAEKTQSPLTVLLSGVAERDPIWNSLILHPGNEKDSGSLDAVGRSSGFLCTPTFELKDGVVRILMMGESRVYAAVDSHLMITGPLHGGSMATLKAPARQWITLNLKPYRGHRVHLEFGPLGNGPLAVWKVIEGAAEEETRVVKLAKLKTDVQSAIVELETHLQQSLESFSNARTEGVGLSKSSGGPDAHETAGTVKWLLANPSLMKIGKESRMRQQAIVDSYYAKRNDLAKKIKTTSRTAIGMMDGSAVNEHVLIRGKYQRPGKVAERSLPSAFSIREQIDDRGSGRLQLANQMIDPGNPLVARVIVNRIWHHLVGRGIVPSVDNFGWLGQRPTHPELLDHLAHQFVKEDKWSIKQMIKRIVLTRTYSMSSRPDNSSAEQQDPNNLLLHRMPIRRLEGEVIRDSVLAVSGRLNAKLYGPPVPVHLTEFVVGRGRPAKSGPLDGDGRRSIYTSVRRNFLPTMMLTFDTPIPFSTVGRRNTTNVPAQSLTMMNDKFVFEQAKVWAEGLQSKLPAASHQQRIEQMYWQAFGRRAKQHETEAALTTIKLLAEHHGVTEDDDKVWTDLCHTFLQVNEFIFLR